MSPSPLPAGCRIIHGDGAAVKQPFADMPLTMHELAAGGATFAGQLGFIPFTTAIRLPRHVHIATSGEKRLLAERILVLNGSGLVELAGRLHVVAPGSLVEIGAGVPHSWTACPAGVTLPDGSRAEGSFLMVYEYEAPTAFFPTAATAPLIGVADYCAHDGAFEPIRIPAINASQVIARGLAVIWNGAPIVIED